VVTKNWDRLFKNEKENGRRACSVEKRKKGLTSEEGKKGSGVTRFPGVQEYGKRLRNQRGKGGERKSRTVGLASHGKLSQTTGKKGKDLAERENRQEKGERRTVLRKRGLLGGVVVAVRRKKSNGTANVHRKEDQYERKGKRRMNPGSLSHKTLGNRGRRDA